jgi:hypothetical protein
MEKKRLPEIQITELFLVKADWTRTFIGTIRREVDGDENPVIIGEVIVHEGKIWSKASCQEELMKAMDDICSLKLDNELHSQPGVAILILENKVFLN